MSMTDKALDPQSQLYIAKSNELIQRTRYHLSLSQQKALLFLISKVKPQDTGSEAYTVSIADFCAAMGIDCNETGGYYYAAVKREIKELADSSAWIMMPNGKEVLFRWLDTVEVEKGSGTISVTFHRSVQPHLFELQRNYTQYRLSEVLPFQSKYSIRLFELLRSFFFESDADNGKARNVTYSLADLQRVLDCTSYKRTNDIKKRVIEPAIAEINEYSSELHVAYKAKMEAGKTVGYIFTVKSPSAVQMLNARKSTRGKISRKK